MGSPQMAKKERIDQLLVERGLADSRTKAQALILSGLVFANNQRIDKAGDKIARELPIEVRGNAIPYVSRGGLKLEAALSHFHLDVTGKVCADIGASTGGFTDCLLQKGAQKVYAVDVGYGQLDVKLRNDPRVIVQEKFNARQISIENIGEPLDIITIDVSFISLKLVVPPLIPLLKPEGWLLPLIKPQFEAGRIETSKGHGVIKDQDVRERISLDMRDFLEQEGLEVKEIMDCPVHGPSGNIEFFAWTIKRNYFKNGKV